MPVYEHAESGVIIVDKPPDISSAKVVAVLKKLFRAKKMGHAGTLDPFATGVMVCCMNKATKLAGFFLKDEKTYVARLRLGIETDTQDLTGNIVSGVTAVDLPENRINAVCRQFEGALEQVPPVFSALKHKGVRLYKLARSGKPFQKPARRIYISYIKVLDINLPDVRLEISCSAGTYIRTLCADIGTALGCGGHLRELRRIQSSGFLITEASPLPELEGLSAAGKLSTRRIGMAAAAHLALSNLTGCTVGFDAHAPARERGMDGWVAALAPGLQPVVSARIEGLGEDDATAAFRAVRALGHIGGEGAAEALRAYVEAHLDPNAPGADARTLMAALRALGRIGDAEATPLLGRVLALDTQHGHGHVRRRNVHVAAAAAEALGQIGSDEAERALVDFCPKLRGFRDYTRVSGDHPVLINCHSSVLHYRILEALDAIGSTDASVLPVFLRSLPEDLDRALLLETDSYENLVGWMAQRCGAADRLAETCLAVLGDDLGEPDGALKEALGDNPIPASHRTIPLEQLFRRPRNGLTFLPYVPEMRAAQVLSVLPPSPARATRVVAVYERFRDAESPDGRQGYASERTRVWVCFYLARYLGRIGGPGVAQALQRSLDHLPPELAAGGRVPPHPMAYAGITPFHRAAAAYSLGRAGGEDGIAALINVIANLDNAVDVRHSAARGLALAAGPDHRIALTRLVADYPEVATRRLLQDACARAAKGP